MTVVVGGQARKVGKTTAVCDIIAATREANWTAVKITAHDHGADLSQPVVHEETQRGSDTDTARYLAAGAARALWIRAQPADLADVLPQHGGNIIYESNAIIDVLTPDLFLFITGEGWKDSATRAIDRADYAIDRVTPALLEQIRRQTSKKPDGA